MKYYSVGDYVVVRYSMVLRQIKYIRDDYFIDDNEDIHKLSDIFGTVNLAYVPDYVSHPNISSISIRDASGEDSLHVSYVIRDLEPKMLGVMTFTDSNRAHLVYITPSGSVEILAGYDSEQEGLRCMTNLIRQMIMDNQYMLNYRHYLMPTYS